MISGVVNGNLEATIRLLIRGPGGPEQEIEAVIDTGFNGFLTLSPALVRRLGLPASWTESGAAGQWEGRATGPLRGYPLVGWPVADGGDGCCRHGRLSGYVAALQVQRLCRSSRGRSGGD
jgi:hypothetical protein